jgi:hypothetical protein
VRPLVVAGEGIDSMRSLVTWAVRPAVLAVLVGSLPVFAQPPDPAAAAPRAEPVPYGEPAVFEEADVRVEPAGYREPALSGDPSAPVPPPSSPARPGAVDAPAVAALAAAPAVRAVRLFAAVGYDHGLNELLEVEFENGSTQTLQLNGGGVLAVGAAFWPLQEGRLETRATLGIKYDSIDARNGSVRYLAFPLEVTESWNVRPLRLSGGAVLLLGPRIRGSGFLGDLDLDLKRSLGLVGQAEWVLPFKSGSGSLSFGLRYLWQKLEPKRGGGALDASALGAVLGATL